MQRNEEKGTQVVVPHLAESLVSAIVGKWLKGPGDDVKEYDVLCELITDKITVQMPSPIEGTLLQILVVEGEEAAVGSTLCLIKEPEDHGPNRTDDYSGRLSPVVQRLARELKIELSDVRGTGLGGRISRKDVLAHGKKASSAIHSAGDEIKAVSPARKTLAALRRQSVSDIPHAWMMLEADVTSIVKLRHRLKDQFLRDEGVKLTYTPFVLKAIVNAIKDYPIVNSSWASDKITIHKEIHVCIAVASGQDVVTPVLRNADRKTIAGIAIELDDLAERARAQTLTLTDMQGGTFTFFNTETYGSILSYPIIQDPQAAIVSFESIVRRPAVIHEECIAIRSMANLCLSFDHRILDGVVAGRFMQRVKQYLEQFDPNVGIY